jgi:heat-inducible transcriptional repressor
VPTDSGYRFYADQALERQEQRPARFPLDLSQMRSEIEAALQSTTEMLSQVTHLLALVSGPGLGSASVRHVEVLVLQPSVVMVVTITSNGGVAKKLFAFDDPVDAGLAAWANEYLNDRLVGVGLGTHLLRRRIEDEGLSPREQRFLDALRPAFVDLGTPPEQALYVGGAASLLDDVRADELEACRRLLSMLEQRAAVLELMSDAFDVRRPFVRVGLPHAGLHGVALVGATYGLPTRTLGTVGLLGPRDDPSTLDPDAVLVGGEPGERMHPPAGRHLCRGLRRQRAGERDEDHEERQTAPPVAENHFHPVC